MDQYLILLSRSLAFMQLQQVFVLRDIFNLLRQSLYRFFWLCWQSLQLFM